MSTNIPPETPGRVDAVRQTEQTVVSSSVEPTTPPPPIPPPDTGVYPPSGRGPTPLPWIVGGVAALALIGLLIFFANTNRTATPTPTPLPAPTFTPVPAPTSTPLAIVVTSTPGPTDTPGPTATPPPAPTETPRAGLPTVTPRPTDTTAPPSPTPAGVTPTPGGSTSGTPEPGAGTTTPGGTPGQTGTPGAEGTRPPAVGTPGTADAAPAAPMTGSLTIQYFGHATFLLAGGEGVRILIDPSGPQVGYRLPFFDPLDALLISHRHPDHYFTEVAPGGVPNLIGLDENGRFVAIQQDIKTAAVRSVASSHGTGGGRDRGENAIWVVDIDGFHVVHLGDLGEPQLTDQQLGDIGRPDILMIPVGGGGFTIDAAQARQIVDQLQPRLVIPMHYRTDRTPPNLNLAPVSDFLGQEPPADAPNVVRLKKADLEGQQPRVLVMNYR